MQLLVKKTLDNLVTFLQAFDKLFFDKNGKMTRFNKNTKVHRDFFLNLFG
jgi:hypothetical protein